MTKVSNIKKMKVSEFRELGYLQEVNRQFLHPLGLALEITINEDNTESISGIWDYRDDPEGIQYGLDTSSSDRIKLFTKKAMFVMSEQLRIELTRKEKLGFTVEPIPLVGKE